PSETLMKVILAQPRGFCAGVVRAIEIVERALKKYGPPVYVRHEIVHNKFVVDSLKAKGAIFVEELSEVPQGAVTIFSAHGVAKSVVNEAAGRQLPVLDATCPLVTKVHNQGKRYVAQGRVLILVGHAGHPEVEGTLGQIDGPVVLVQSEKDVEALDISPDTPVAYVTQTTLSVDDTRGIIAALTPLPKHRRAGDQRHLLRHAKSPIGGAGTEPSRRCDPGGRRQEQFQFQSPARDRCGGRDSELSHRRRQRTHAGMGQGRPNGRYHRRRLRPRGAGRGRHDTLRRFGEVEASTLPGREEHIEFRLPRELAASRGVHQIA